VSVATSPLADALRDRYVIERELGRGGMAVVYLARDLRHDRRVALKVLPPELASAVSLERFLREIRVAAGLAHPHILPVLDSGKIDGVPYYTMPFVEGESLRAKLDREKQLPLDDALQIASEVADALSYAHGQGVVHRDIKPGNILVEAGHAVVSDFGLARALTAAGNESLTVSGLVIGTPAYMSPEQAAGGPEVDARADIYSLGCVLYEMLAGEPPFTGPTPQAVLAKRVTLPPPSIRTVRDAVPESIDNVLLKALAKVPADRFAAAGEFAKALAAATHGKRSFPLDAVPLDSEEARDFLQHRLSQLGKWSFLIASLAVLMEIGVIGEIQWLMSPFGFTNLALLAELGAVWLVCRMPLRIPTLWLRVIDTAVVIGMSVAGVAMTALAAPDADMPPAWPTPALVLYITLYFRAALIPSTPLRTAVLGTIGAAIIVIGSYLYLVQGLGIADPGLIRVMAGFVAIWCTVAVAGSTLASHVIFKLRTRAREAAHRGRRARRVLG
jgi:hypothetical protein